MTSPGYTKVKKSILFLEYNNKLHNSIGSSNLPHVNDVIVSVVYLKSSDFGPLIIISVDKQESNCNDKIGSPAFQLQLVYTRTHTLEYSSDLHAEAKN